MVLWWKRFSLELSYLSPPMKQFAFARMVDFHYESAIPKWSRDMGHVAYFKQIVVSSVSLSYLQTFYKKHICPLLYIPPHLQIPRLDQLQCRFHDFLRVTHRFLLKKASKLSQECKTLNDELSCHLSRSWEQVFCENTTENISITAPGLSLSNVDLKVSEITK